MSLPFAQAARCRNAAPAAERGGEEALLQREGERPRSKKG